MPLLGAHMSIAGGFHKAVNAAATLDMDVVQIFTAAPQKWPVLAGKTALQSGGLLTKTASQSYTEPSYSPGDVLVFGSETNGLPPALMQSHPGHTLRIPMREQVRSLNLAASAAVAMYEAVRQIRMNES